MALFSLPHSAVYFCSLHSIVSSESLDIIIIDILKAFFFLTTKLLFSGKVVMRVGFSGRDMLVIHVVFLWEMELKHLKLSHW